ncbi:MAG: CBS domain-containing protein [Myxococcota bacterium]
MGSGPHGALRAADIATRPALAVERGDPACHAEQLMRVHRVRHVVLTEGGKAVGMVSHRDLVAAAGPSVGVARAAGHGGLLSVSEHAALREAVDVMLDSRVGAVPLLDAGGHAIAVLTRRDLVRAMVERGWGEVSRPGASSAPPSSA